MKKIISLFIALILSVSLLSGQVLANQNTPNVKNFVTTSTLSAVKKDVTVYITRTGEKYHKSGCRYLSKSKIAIKLSKAKQRKFTACSVCKPTK